MKVVLVLLVCSMVLVDLISGHGGGGGHDGGRHGGGGIARLEWKLKELMFKVGKLSHQIKNIPINLYKFKQIYYKRWGGGGWKWGGKKDGEVAWSELAAETIALALEKKK